MDQDKEYALVRRQDLALMPPLRQGQTDRLLYDGMCGLCHRAVKFILRNDVSEGAFRFMPLQSERVEEVLPGKLRPEMLPDSMVVVTQQGEVLMKSDAALYIGERMGGIWRILGLLGKRVPRGLRDSVYDLIASIRHRLFAKPDDMCPVQPERVRGFFEY